MGLLPEALLWQVCEVIRDAGDCEDVLAVLPPDIRCALPTGRTPAAQLLLVGRSLNTWVPARDSEPPLLIFLRSARFILGPRRERDVVDEAISTLLRSEPRTSVRTEGVRDFLSRRAKDYFESCGYRISYSTYGSETFIAHRRTGIVSVVGVSVESVDQAINAVVAEARLVQRYEPLVEGCVVLPQDAGSDLRRVEEANLRAIWAHEMRQMSVQDVEDVARRQLSASTTVRDDEGSQEGNTVEEQIGAFFASARLRMLVFFGDANTVARVGRGIFRALATEFIEGTAQCAPLHLSLSKVTTLDDVVSSVFRESGAWYSALSMRRLLEDRLVLPMFELGEEVLDQPCTADVVRQALGNTGRTLLLLGSKQGGPPADLASRFSLRAAETKVVAITP